MTTTAPAAHMESPPARRRGPLRRLPFLLPGGIALLAGSTPR